MQHYTNISVYIPARDCAPEMADISFTVVRSRALWRFFHPILFESNDNAVLQHALSLLLLFLSDALNLSKDVANVPKHVVQGVGDTIVPVHARTIPLRLPANAWVQCSKLEPFQKLLQSNNNNLSVWILPTTLPIIEYSFESRLVRWEHDLIRAQTMAGYLATLGGGYFMCHHFATAVTLARQQQRVAAVLGDSEMFYKCSINQAYNYAYAGKFKVAKLLLVSVYQRLQRDKPLEQQLLQNMVVSALLFCKRVRAHYLRNQNLVQRGMLDDFARVRVVRDVSTCEDVIRPFSY
jgi:hypothetical protein